MALPPQSAKDIGNIPSTQMMSHRNINHQHGGMSNPPVSAPDDRADPSDSGSTAIIERDGDSPAKKRSKRGRHAVNCAECRRLKLRCDRQVPCTNCVRRKCPEICPSHTRAKMTRFSKPPAAEPTEYWQQRASDLEKILEERGISLDREQDSLQKPVNTHDSPRSGQQGDGDFADLTTISADSMLQGSASGGLSQFKGRYDRPETRNIVRISTHVPSPAAFGDFGTSTIMPTAATDLDVSPAHNPYTFGSSSQSGSCFDDTGMPRITRPPASVSEPSPGSRDQSFGTLVIGESGRSKYLGPTAGTEWLKNQERHGLSRLPSEEVDDTAIQPPTPEVGGQNSFALFGHDSLHANTVQARTELYNRLPREEDARILVQAYFRFFGWNHNPVPQQNLEAILASVYSPAERIGRSSDSHPERMLDSHPAGRLIRQEHRRPIHIHQLALLYAVLAIGVHHSLEYSPNDPVSMEYLELAKRCLSIGDFLVQNTIPGLQALNIMAHLLSESEEGRTGDLAWPLWGLSMRIIQAMGVHRDGTRWNLPDKVVEERRLVFWECHTIDVFQAHCYSRPASMRACHIDTNFPFLPQLYSQPDAAIAARNNPSRLPHGEARDFKRVKYELVMLFEAVEPSMWGVTNAGLPEHRTLDQAMNIEPTPYTRIVQLYEKLCNFDNLVPFELRCRNALLVTPSRCPTQEAAMQDSPPVDRRDMQRTFEQFTLALNISEAILFLQRPYYVKAMQESPQDPIRSDYGRSFLAVVERCNVTIQVACGIADMFPAVASRHWFYWYHLFTAAMCIGTLVLRCPNSPLAPLGRSIISQAISAYTVVIRHNPSASLKSNHRWLLRLQQRVLEIDHNSFSSPVRQPGDALYASDEAGDELLGWRTRLIERASSGTLKRATTINSQALEQPVPSLPEGDQFQRFREQVEPRSQNGPLNVASQSGLAANPDGTGVEPFSLLDILSMPRVDAQLPSADALMQQHVALRGYIDMEGVRVGSGIAADPDVTNSTAMDMLLHSFWDPQLFPEQNGGCLNSFSNVNWWAGDTQEEQ